MWYEDFLEEYKLGRLELNTDKTVCTYNKGAESPKPEDVEEFIPVDSFYLCLREWFTSSDIGKEAVEDIAWTVDKDTTSEIKGWRQFIIPKKISDQATDGPKYLDATRDLEK